MSIAVPLLWLLAGAATSAGAQQHARKKQEDIAARMREGQRKRREEIEQQVTTATAEQSTDNLRKEATKAEEGRVADYETATESLADIGAPQGNLSTAYLTSLADEVTKRKTSALERVKLGAKAAGAFDAMTETGLSRNRARQNIRETDNYAAGEADMFANQINRVTPNPWATLIGSIMSAYGGAGLASSLWGSGVAKGAADVAAGASAATTAAPALAGASQTLAGTLPGVAGVASGNSINPYVLAMMMGGGGFGSVPYPYLNAGQPVRPPRQY